MPSPRLLIAPLVALLLGSACIKLPDIDSPPDAGAPEADAGPDAGAPPPDHSDAGGNDAGTTDAGTVDAGICAGVLACSSNDGCCPSGCHANNDNDCQPVCGNAQIEPGESCDDGNTLNGDNCDPSCHYFNTLTLLSGVPGDQTHADGVTGASTRFYSPYGLAWFNSTLIVADPNAFVIRQVRLSDGMSTTLAGLPQFRGASVDGIGPDAVVAEPWDVANVGNQLYIVDSHQSVRRLDPTTREVTTLNLGLNSIKALGVDGANLLIVASGGLYRWNPSAGGAPSLVSSNVSGCNDVTLGPPGDTSYYLACGSSILKVNPSTGSATVYAGDPTTSGCSDADGGLTNARFSTARNLVWGYNGTWNTLYITDSGCNTIRQIVQGGSVSTVAGSGMAGDADSTNLRAAQFSSPMGILTQYDSAKSTTHLYVADFDNGTIRHVTISGGVSTLAGAAPHYYYHGSNVYADAGTNSYYKNVTDLASDGQAGFVYATTGSEKSLIRISHQNGASTQLLTFPADTHAVTRIGGDLYVAVADGTIQKVDTATPTSSTAFAGQMGKTSPAQDGDLSSAILSARVMTSDGKAIFFLDENKTIRKIDLATRLVTTLAGGGNPETLPDGGTLAMVDGVGRNARFDTPESLACDGQNLYTLDAHGTVIRKIAIATGEVTTIAGEAYVQSKPQDGVGREARFASAAGLASDGQRLFISDPGPGFASRDLAGPTLRMMDLRTNSVTTMIGSKGQWSIQSGVGTNALVNVPGPITFDPDRNWLVLYDTKERAFVRIR